MENRTYKDMYKALIDMADMVSPDYDFGKVTRDEVIDFLWDKYCEEKRLEEESTLRYVVYSFSGGVPPIIVPAKSFDEAIAKARKLRPEYTAGFVYYPGCEREFKHSNGWEEI